MPESQQNQKDSQVDTERDPGQDKDMSLFEKRIDAIADSFAFRLRALPSANQHMKVLAGVLKDMIRPYVYRGKAPEDTTRSKEQLDDSVAVTNFKTRKRPE